jgi:DNA mismatch endonuclease, patch repair protein
MRAVRQRNTAPELTVRRMLHARGWRYRLHRKDLPGSPDLVFPSRRKAIFVHGCFWHGHDCRAGRAPKTREAFWSAKLRNNRDRDRRAEDALRELGWEPIVVWQCELKQPEVALRRLEEFLGPHSSVCQPKQSMNTIQQGKSNHG